VRRLPLSLLFVVLLGIFSVGVILDELFDRYRPEPTTALAEIQALGQGLADVLRSNDSSQLIVENWPESSPYDFTLESIADMALPPVLRRQLSNAVVGASVASTFVVSPPIAKAINQGIW